MDVRPGAAVDRAAVEEIVTAAYEPWIEVIGMRPIPMLADYGDLLAQGRVWVAEPLDALIVLVPEDGVLLVDNVAVRPEAQGRGLGRALLAFAEDHARALGLPALRLYTNVRMTSNIALYERLGYHRTDTETIDGRHAVHMRKTL